MFRKTLLPALAIVLFLAAANCLADVAAQLQQAADYKDKGYYKQAEDAYKSIIQNNPATESAFKARQKLAILYIVTERTNGAASQIDTMKAEFAGRSDLPDALYWIAKRYREEGHAERATSIYRQIVRQYPASAYAKKAQLDAPRTDILELLNLGRYDEAEAAIDKLLTDFTGNPELPETLYDIGRACKTSGRYAKAKSLYQYILQHYPNCSYAEFCPLQIRKMDIWAAIASGNFTAAQAATDKLITDFASDPELPDALHGIARRYEVKEVKRYQDAQNLYQRIVQLYPASAAAAKAKLDIEKDIILSLMESGKDAVVRPAVDKMMLDFSANKQYLPRVISQEIATRYYQKGLALERTDPNHAKACFQTAAALWEKVINQLTGPGVTAEACCLAGECYLKLGDLQKAAACYQKVVDNYPIYRRGWHALAMVGNINEQMKQKGLVSAAEADARTRASYQQLVDTYPECRATEHARKWLSR